MARFLDSIGLAYFWEKIKSLVQQNTHEYSVEELETPTAGYRNSFRLDKDGDAITGSDTIDIPTELTPIVSKQYLDDTFYASTTSFENSSRYFMTVTPDAENTFWYVKFRVRVWIPVDTTDKRFTDSIIEYFGSGISMKGYRIWNTINTGSAAYYQAAFWLTASGLTNGFGHVLGTSIQYGTNYTNSAWYRYVKVDLLAYEGCSVGVFDALTKWTPYKESVGASSSDYLTYMSTYNATSQGLIETGDDTDTTTMQLYYAKVISGTYGIKNRSLIMEDGNGKWQSFTTTSGTGTSKTKNDSGFRLGSHIYYVSTSTDIAADTAIGVGIVRAFVSMIDLRYSLNINTTAGGTANNLLPYKPVYIVGTIGNDGLFYLDDVWWTQTEPSTENNKIYIKVAEAVYNDYENNRCYRADLLSSGHAYWYKDGRFQRYYDVDWKANDDEVVHKAGAETINGEKTFEANVNLTEGATLNLIYDSQTPDGVYLQATEPNGIKAVSFSGISDDGMVQIKNVYVPTEDTDAATKFYVDESILDIDEYRVYLACKFGPYGVQQKSLCAFCLANGGREMMMTSFTKTSGTGAKEVITDLVFPIGCKIYYNDGMYDSSPNLSGMANRYYTSFNGVDVRYSAITGTSISLGNYPTETQSTVYLHVIVENGYWRPYYKEGATNEIIVDSFHMQSGNFYIYLGKTVRNTGYTIQLEDNNQLYYYNGTDLIDYATRISDIGSSSVLPSGGTTGQVLAKASDADNDVEWVNQKGGYNFAFEIDGLDLKVTYGDSVEEPEFEIVDNNLVVTLNKN